MESPTCFHVSPGMSSTWSPSPPLEWSLPLEASRLTTKPSRLRFGTRVSAAACRLSIPSPHTACFIILIHFFSPIFQLDRRGTGQSPARNYPPSDCDQPFFHIIIFRTHYSLCCPLTGITVELLAHFWCTTSQNTRPTRT